MSVLIATQGVPIQSMLDAINNYLIIVSELHEKLVIRWDGTGRPEIEGRNSQIWYTLSEEIPDKSQGPGRFGNRVDPSVTVNYSVRSMKDTAQRDPRRWEILYAVRWKLIQA